MIDINMFNTVLHEALINLVQSKEFIIKHGMRNSDTQVLGTYYTKVLCHSAFISCFIESLSLWNIINESSSLTEALKTIEVLFYPYIENPSQAIHNIIIGELPANFDMHKRKDMMMFLMEYAKLLSMSKSKFNLVTSNAFLEQFLSSCNWFLYIEHPPYSLNNLLLLGEKYYYNITHIKVNYIHAAYHDVTKQVYSMTREYYYMWRKNMYSLTSDDILKTAVTLKDMYIIYSNPIRSPLFETNVSSAVAFNILIEEHIVSPGALNEAYYEELNKKITLLIKQARSLFRLEVECDRITLWFGIFIIFHKKF